MLNTKKLLYILPEVAYIAEVLPDKKPHTFAVQSFTQINGTFLDEDTFIPANVIKLFSKLEKEEEYHIILPDYLFTNTIVTIKEKSDQRIKEELRDTVLPQMGLSTESHVLDSSVLNEIRGNSRVQLSAIEKEVLAPLKVAAHHSDITVVGVSPLSWVIKSLVSLEPSISVLQMGGNLYVCEHYIGIDQASYAPIDNLETIIESIKTLKGSEPSIQTVYLLSNSLIEEKLKDLLNKILPIQQMTRDGDGQEKMPAHVQDVIEYSARTLSISDYPVPVFALGKATAEELEVFKSELAASKSTHEEDDDALAELPKPAAPVVAPVSIPVIAAKEPADTEASSEGKAAEKEELSATEEPEEDEPEEEVEPDDDDDAALNVASVGAVIPPAAAAVTLATAPITPDELTSAVELPTSEVKASEPSKSPEKVIPDVAKEPESISVAKHTEPPKVAVEPDKITTQPEARKASDEDIDLTQFVQAQSTTEQPTRLQTKSMQPPAALPTIKNKSGVQTMLKMIFITLAVFCVTVAVGVGVGLAILKFSGTEGSTDAPTVEVESTPTPVATTETTPTPSPSASASAKPVSSNLKVLIVNATTKAGYAGTFKTKIETAKLGTVTAANAKEKYTEGFIVYMKTEDAATIASFEKAMAVELTVDKKAAAEDPQNKYDIVIVLAE